MDHMDIPVYRLFDKREKSFRQEITAQAPPAAAVMSALSSRIPLPASAKIFAMVRYGQGTFPAIGRLTMGEIALAVYKTHPLVFGQVREIGADGLRLQYLGKARPDVAEMSRMAILAPVQGLMVQGICFDVLSDMPVSKPRYFDSFDARQMQVRFTRMGACPRRQLNGFLAGLSHSRLSTGTCRVDMPAAE